MMPGCGTSFEMLAMVVNTPAPTTFEMISATPSFTRNVRRSWFATAGAAAEAAGSAGEPARLTGVSWLLPGVVDMPCTANWIVFLGAIQCTPDHHRLDSGGEASGGRDNASRTTLCNPTLTVWSHTSV